MIAFVVFVLAGAGAARSAVALAHAATPLADVVAITASGATRSMTVERRACALTRAGRVLCWGDLFDGSAPGGGRAYIATTAEAVAGLDDAVQLDDARTCALRRDGSLFCWGEDEDAEFASRAATLPPARFIGGDCALLRDSDDVLCWGLGVHPRVAAWTRVATARGATRVLETAFGGCVRGEEAFVCWSRAFRSGEPLRGLPRCLPPWARPGGPPAPPEASLFGDPWGSLLAIDDEGRLVSWPLSTDDHGACHPETMLHAPEGPVRLVLSPNPAGERQIACAIDASRELRCADDDGREVVALSGAVDVTTNGAGTFCAALTDGSARCWGGTYGGFGALGDATLRGSSTPVRVLR